MFDSIKKVKTNEGELWSGAVDLKCSDRDMKIKMVFTDMEATIDRQNYLMTNKLHDVLLVCKHSNINQMCCIRTQHSHQLLTKAQEDSEHGRKVRQFIVRMAEYWFSHAIKERQT